MRVITTSDDTGYYWRLLDADGTSVHVGTVPYTTEQAAHHAGARQLRAHNANEREKQR